MKLASSAVTQATYGVGNAAVSGFVALTSVALYTSHRVHGASRGSSVFTRISPVSGATRNGLLLHQLFCRPWRGLWQVIRFTHDLRRGLSSGAAPQLVSMAKSSLWRAGHPKEIMPA